MGRRVLTREDRRRNGSCCSPRNCSVSNLVCTFFNASLHVLMTQGLFYSSDSGDYWFPTACNRPNEYYELVGAVFGLAIYNQTPLFAPFPPFLFKKLAAAAPRQAGAGMSWRHVWRPTLRDLAQLSPDLAR